MYLEESKNRDATITAFSIKSFINWQKGHVTIRNDCCDIACRLIKCILPNCYSTEDK